MSSANDVEVFRSDVPFEAEMIAESLEAEGIACSVRRELPGGLQLTMLETAAPPGQWAVVLVPRAVEERARELISTFRPPADVFDTGGEDEPETPSSRRSKPAATARKAYARMLLFLMLIPLLIGLILLVAAIFE